ncbi:hypothetical protein C0993_002095 [Termitomyces sp. T159_Od127]|nr:hypothetical protein C0993_002095 [Termitomyces sp. T159_Od127]
MVMEGLLDQIKLMRRQHITTLEQIDCTAKRKLPVHEGSSVEPKWAKPQPPQPMEVARAVAPMVACPGPAVALTTPVLPAWPPAAPVQAVPIESQAPDAPLAELSLEQQDEEMSDMPLDQDEMASGPPNWGLAMSAMGPGMQGPSRPSRGCKPPLKVDNMEIVDFLAGVPT